MAVDFVGMFAGKAVKQQGLSHRSKPRAAPWAGSGLTGCHEVWSYTMARDHLIKDPIVHLVRLRAT